MKITLQDIARMSGVSKTTVSYVLNNRQTTMGISQQTIDKVRSVMDEVGYKPNKAAVSLASQRKKKTRVIIVSPWLTSSNTHFMTEMSRAIKDVQKNIDAEYITYTINNLKKTLGNLKRLGAFDGMLVIGTGEKDNEYLKTLNTEQRKNIVLLNREVEGITSVCTDDYKGGMLIASHVLKSKCYKKYILITPSKATQAVQKRLNGIKDTFKAGNMKLDSFKCGDWGEGEFETLHAKYRKDSVMVFTFQDMMAIPLISYLAEHNVSVPEQVGVTGYDAIEMSRYVTPALTTIDAKNYDISKKAIDIFLSKSFSGTTHLIEPELVIRHSSN